MFAALVDDGILIHPACARRIRTDDGMYAFWQTPADLLQVFNDTRARPIEVGAIQKDNIDVGVSEHSLGADGFYMRRGKETGNDRIGHLVLYYIGWLTRPGCMNDHLHVRDVRQRVQWYMLQRPNSGKCEQQDYCKDKETIASADFNEARKHYMPPVAFTRNCF